MGMEAAAGGRLARELLPSTCCASRLSEAHFQVRQVTWKFKEWLCFIVFAFKAEKYDPYNKLFNSSKGTLCHNPPMFKRFTLNLIFSITQKEQSINCSKQIQKTTAVDWLHLIRGSFTQAAKIDSLWSIKSEGPFECASWTQVISLSSNYRQTLHCAQKGFTDSYGLAPMLWGSWSTHFEEVVFSQHLRKLFIHWYRIGCVNSRWGHRKGCCLPGDTLPVKIETSQIDGCTLHLWGIFCDTTVEEK